MKNYPPSHRQSAFWMTLCKPPLLGINIWIRSEIGTLRSGNFTDSRPLVKASTRPPLTPCATCAESSEIINMQNVSHAGNDRPVKEGQDDRYGFEPLAAGLARRILALNRTVIGIEGRWGAGKTSLLNLLMEHLSERKSEKTKILPISPWLSPPGSPLMESLMLSVAALLIVHI